MIRKIIILTISISLNGCAIAFFDKGLNYKKTPNYKFEYDREASGSVSFTNQKNGKYIGVSFRHNSCGGYGLIGPIIPFFPIWHSDDCKNVSIGIYQAKKVHMTYHDKIYKPSDISSDGYYYTFLLPTKSITDIAILFVEDKNGEIFEIPFKYQHTFGFGFLQ